MNKINIQFKKCLAAVSPEISKRVEYSFDIADKIFELLEQRGISQKELAQIMGKKESQVSRWVQASHNFTLETLAAISVALGEDLIEIPCKRNMISKFSKPTSSVAYFIGGAYNNISNHRTTYVNSIAAQQHSETTNYCSGTTKVVNFNSQYGDTLKQGKLTLDRSLCN